MRRSAPRNLSQRLISAAMSGAIFVCGIMVFVMATADAVITLLPSPFLKPPESDRPNLMATRIVDVLVPVALDQTYSYRVPEGLELVPGDVVTVPLGARGETCLLYTSPSPRDRQKSR